MAAASWRETVAIVRAAPWMFVGPIRGARVADMAAKKRRKSKPAETRSQRSVCSNFAELIFGRIGKLFWISKERKTKFRTVRILSPGINPKTTNKRSSKNAKNRSGVMWASRSQILRFDILDWSELEGKCPGVFIQCGQETDRLRIVLQANQSSFGGNCFAGSGLVKEAMVDFPGGGPLREFYASQQEN